ncbi:HugZ family protein [Leucothrix arctica]|uniref:Pyridoxamine 5'-phosphate oxidase n=1 Tax=Leucothrix arctica TaxID=1481894 RepID=A0A317CG34_9GAMM|nr:pyridoxamine 5'-phosphate oxidase family protein [Leucothrix arctica]PWQ95182.1 pyridoxamine 5'-phosphate oxidase [Leucothrix arctica]
MTQQDERIQTYNEILLFRESFETLLMSTSNGAGIPEASYAGYIEDEGDYYIYTSELAKHTGNLIDNPNCSILFIENEHSASHLLARKRLTYTCEVTEVSRSSHVFNQTLDKLTERFGFVMNNLRDMTDFHLFRLHPVAGRYISGFAKAFTLTGGDLKTVKHQNEGGHRKSPTKETA